MGLTSHIVAGVSIGLWGYLCFCLWVMFMGIIVWSRDPLGVRVGLTWYFKKNIEYTLNPLYTQ